MAFLLRNLRPGTLVIALTDVVLPPGGFRRVNEFSEPLQHAFRMGYIAVEEIDVGADSAAEDELPSEEGKAVIEVHGPDDEAPPPAAPSLAKYTVTDAVTLIGAITEVGTLEAFLDAEISRSLPRKTLVTALNRRMAELKGGPKP